MKTKTQTTTQTTTPNKRSQKMGKITRIEFIHISEISGRVIEHVTHLPTKSWIEYDARWDKKIIAHVHVALHEKGAFVVMFNDDDATFAFWFKNEERERVDNANASIKLYNDALHGDVLRIVSRDRRLLYLFSDALDVARVQYARVERND
jgi:hypothetical protein